VLARLTAAAARSLIVEDAETHALSPSSGAPERARNLER
jgi:hypothetical protein